MKSRIYPFLWFDEQAEEAARFYTSVFPNSSIDKITHYTEVGPRPAGMVLTVEFTLDGAEFVALNGGPEYGFTPAISFTVICDSQEEVDHYWSKLTDGGTAIQCGWLTDRYGVTWQIVPKVLPELLQDEDEARANRVMEAMMPMVKLDIAALRRAYEGK